MESKPRVRDVLLTAIAPAAWGSTYIVTELFLPAGRPVFSAAVRSLPIGLLLLAFTRQLPKGDWWWRAIVLGVCNIGLFFPLIFVSAYRLPGGLAATLQATGPFAVMTVAWLLIKERPTLRRLLGAALGLVGVMLLVGAASQGADPLGLVGAFGSVIISALGFVLLKRWRAPVSMLTLVSWQLVVGGMLLVPLALLIEGAPPALTGRNLIGYLWIGLIGTALAYVCWFRGLTRMTAGATSLIGLVNPVVGTVLGVVFAGEVFGPWQALGTALVLGGVVWGQGLSRRRAAGGGVSERPPAEPPQPADR